MGKPTGFLDYERETAKVLPPKERIQNFNEFRIPLNKEKQKLQGARCMACGVPFCQAGMMIGGMASGCPLHRKLEAGIPASEQDTQLSGIYIQSVSGTL